ncbi:MAG TPA: acyl-CoA dehydrogenase family protein [Deltaproteobacteria bacterium]|nr:acyl-CoA dehydrogenase family protein [Deltaproteobacteria bacterium]HQI80972.1 acyl-CoA dehydrogenase family protein [Deltaproteobacteria bacterium]
MTYRDIDLDLSPLTQSMLSEVRKFAMDMMRPAGIALDRLADPADVIADSSVLWDVFRGFRELGLHTLQIPSTCGGMAGENDPMASILIAEQLGYADAGLAISMGVSCMPFNFAALIPTPAMQQLSRDFCADREGRLIGCWAITEPDHGTDWSLGGSDPRCGPSVKAVLRGDEYIINGEKSAWVSNGTIATHALLHVSLDPSRGMQGQGLAIVPLDLPGISRGKPLDKMGQRPLNQGSLIFEEVRMPKGYMVVPYPDLINASGGQGLATVNGGMAVVFAGLAKAAFDEALAYARQRVQGGVPIIEHAPVKLKLMKMFEKVEAARASARRMALYNVRNPLAPSVVHAVAAKCLSTETATFVASEAMQIMGGYGLAKEFPVEKMYRDARASMIEDGVNEALAIRAMDYL